MVDYSKWKDIEISDDEDDTHPNIDTPSLFRWRHQARVERMNEQEKKKQAIENERKNNQKQLETIQQELKNCSGNEEKLSQLQAKLKEVESKKSELNSKFDELRLQEKKTPWNVDTISKPAFSKTIINKTTKRSDDDLTEEEKEVRMRDFVKDNKKLLEQFGMLRRYDDSKKYLLDHPHLACESTANYLVIWCINLQMEEKTSLMEHVAHQCICMQYILELAKQLDADPRACIGPFFDRIQVADIEYKKHFDLEVESFKERIKKRALEKIEDALAEQEEEERKQRLGPGGLDPVEVFESLPESLQKCFESRDIALLQETIKTMPEDEAKLHLKRCVDSGLWVPDASKVEKDGETSEADDGAAASSSSDAKPKVSTEDVD
ncbi:hsp90 co-chaperone Cdc37-like [Contarinia nasturtii]|uniref:hsp90 co-chaperone Cdc37-like n=1 Tax=Contarinia nasturtii TaxID=265458 RepID=UPI0012D4089B|nr:hsp90 co-chaperone Cdc37-like [Contarinia nasturtii]